MVELLIGGNGPGRWRLLTDKYLCGPADSWLATNYGLVQTMGLTGLEVMSHICDHSNNKLPCVLTISCENKN